MEGFKKALKEWIIPFALEIIAVLLIIKFVFFFAVVPTGSMIPTVSEGSWLFATRMYNPEKNVARGDIIVFYSDELQETLLKRCIGLPGDVVDVDEFGEVTINGEVLDEPYVVNMDGTAGHFEVPEDSFLFFGDNRASSFDARYWNNPYVPAEQLKGEARFTLWPLSNFGLLK